MESLVGLGKVTFGSGLRNFRHHTNAATRNTEVEKLSDYFRISEAARFLGVSPNTVRNWVDAGKLAAVRHPVNKYRLFKLADLEAMLRLPQPISGRADRRRV